MLGFPKNVNSWITSDGKLFHERVDADLHEALLENNLRHSSRVVRAQGFLHSVFYNDNNDLKGPIQAWVQEGEAISLINYLAVCLASTELKYIRGVFKGTLED